MHYGRLPITEYCWSHTDLHLALPCVWSESRPECGRARRAQMPEAQTQGVGAPHLCPLAPGPFLLSSVASKSQQLVMDPAVSAATSWSRAVGTKLSVRGREATGCRRSSKKNSKGKKGLHDRARKSWSSPANPIYTIKYKLSSNLISPGVTLLFNNIYTYFFKFDEYPTKRTKLAD